MSSLLNKVTALPKAYLYATFAAATLSIPMQSLAHEAPSKDDISDQAFQFSDFICKWIEADADFIVVDYKNSQLTIVDDCKLDWEDTILYDETYDGKDSNNLPAGHYTGQLYSHKSSGGKTLSSYHDNTALFVKFNATGYSPAIHAMNNPGRDANRADGDTSNNNVTKGCIDTSKETFDRVVSFALDEQVLNTDGKTQTDTPIFVLPADDTSMTNTLKVLGFGNWIPHINSPSPSSP